MKIGVFGGTFDPVHFGHLILAETAREACQLDEVVFMPAQQNPHKQGRPGAPPRHRIDMLRLAIAGHPQFRVSDLEIRREGPSYTIDTLRQLAAEHPDDELFLLMGADSLLDFPSWKESQAILEIARVVGVNRGKIPAEALGVLQKFGSEWTDRVAIIEMPAVDLSASAIRASSARGASVRYQTPRAVELYLAQHRLYND